MFPGMSDFESLEDFHNIVMTILKGLEKTISRHSGDIEFVNKARRQVGGYFRGDCA
jgi:hypothetical protein